jgi:hypothetical protein
MLFFRGFNWIYDVTEANEKTRARAASFVCRLNRAGDGTFERLRRAGAPTMADIIDPCRLDTGVNATGLEGPRRAAS